MCPKDTDEPVMRVEVTRKEIEEMIGMKLFDWQWEIMTREVNRGVSSES